jgi:hypothetical protein
MATGVTAVCPSETCAHDLRAVAYYGHGLIHRAPQEKFVTSASGAQRARPQRAECPMVNEPDGAVSALTCGGALYPAQVGQCREGLLHPECKNAVEPPEVNREAIGSSAATSGAPHGANVMRR